MFYVSFFQAAVSSASSNSDENVTSNSNNQSSDSSENQNFFSLSEDTPQNSPMKTIPLNSASTPSSSKAVSVDLYSPSSQNSNSAVSNNNGTSFTIQRTRRLSNSSIASDVSFRLPHYESQPVRLACFFVSLKYILSSIVIYLDL